LVCDDEARICYINQLFVETFQNDASEILGKPIFDVVPKTEAQRIKRFIKRLLTSTKPIPFNLKWTDKNENEFSLNWVFRKIVDDQGSTYYIGNAMPDVDHNGDINGKLYNSITGLPKKYFFEQSLTRSLAQLTRSPDYRLAVMYIDLDRLQRVNVTYGAGVVEEVLVYVAKTLKENTRPGDTVVHFGSDKFGIIFDDLRGIKDIVKIAKDICYAISMRRKTQHTSIQVTASIGVVYPHAGDTVAEVEQRADAAMHKAKTLGRNRVELYTPESNRKTVAKMHMETLLHQAIEKGMNEYFFYEFMPIVDLKTGEISKFEALMRMRDPQNSHIIHSPMLFIPIAEETQLINHIGRWGIEEGCRIIKSWQEKFPEEKTLGLSVNVSYIQLINDGFIPMVKQLLKRYKIQPGRLRFEITETIAHAHTEFIIKVLTQLHDLNVHTLIDDVGTGNHSLSQVLRMPSIAFKSDKGFLAQNVDANTRENNMEALEVISTMGIKKHKLTIAEGVETEEQLKMVLSLNYTHAQGFWFMHKLQKDAGPVDLDIAEAMIRSKPFVKKVTKLYAVGMR